MVEVNDMIQFKSIHPYSNKHNKWYKLLNIETYTRLDFEDYDYIIGDKIFREPSAEAEKAFNTAKMWAELQA